MRLDPLCRYSAQSEVAFHGLRPIAFDGEERLGPKTDWLVFLMRMSGNEALLGCCERRKVKLDC